mgnify:FL=1
MEAKALPPVGGFAGAAAPAENMRLYGMIVYIK